MRYFLLKNIETLEVYVSQDLEEQPENSVAFFENEFRSANFDKYPNPTTITELLVEAVIEVPQEVALWKIRAVLKSMGLEEQIKQSFELLEEPNKTGAKYIWEYGTSIERQSKTVLFIQQVLQMTEEQVDNIFINANNITL